MSNHLEFVWGPNREALGWNLSDLFAPVRDRMEFPVLHAPVNLVETENQYVVELDVPGVPKDAIKIEFTDGRLTISGERKFEKSAEKSTLHLNERSHGKFSRTFELPQTVEAEKAEAIHADGVLKVTIPKAEKVRPKTIEIKTA